MLFIKKFKSISNKILAIILSANILLIILLSVVSSVFAIKMLNKLIHNSTMKNVQAYSDVIGNWFYEKKNEVEIYSQIPIIRTMDWKKIQPYLVEQMRDKEAVYKTIFIADKNGDYYTHSDGYAGNIKDRKYFKEAMKNEVVISQPILSKTEGRPSVVIAAPIVDKDEKVIGIVGEAIDLEKLYEFVEGKSIDLINNYTYIVDKNGLIIIHPSQDVIMKESISNESKYVGEDLIKASKKILSNEYGEVVYMHENTKRSAYYRKIPYTNDWKIVTAFELKYLYQPVLELGAILLLIGIVGIILVSVISKLVAKSISTPIIDLTKVFNKAAAGDLTVRAKIDHNDELGKAAKSFNIMMETISNLTYYDPLTSLPKLNFFNDRVKFEIKYRKYDKKRLAIITISLDKFKKVNDVFGHVVGDDLLKELPKRFKKVMWENNIMCRMSGDEFLILLPEIDNEDSVLIYLNNIMNEIRKPWIVDEKEFYITASIGVAFYPENGMNEQELLKSSGIAKSKAKEDGGDSYIIYNHDMDDVLFTQIKLDNLLYAALEKKEFLLYYQPIVSLESGKIIEAEALIRWNSKELGLVSPDGFITRIEENGLIMPVGEWVIREACSQNKKWQQQGLKPICISVNASVNQFEKSDLVETVKNILEETSLEARYIKIEITEGLVINDIEDKIKRLNELRNMGVKIAVDDFGTGYSSLSYLNRLPINTLKVDQSFVKNLPQDSNSAAIVSTIIYMGIKLNIDITAEGVETTEQLEFIRKQKCDKAQGYLFSKPVPAEIFEKLLKENRTYL